MRFRYFKLLLYGLVFMALSSCTSVNVIGDVPVKFERPGSVMDIDCDTSFTFDFPEVLSCAGLELVNDSVLFLYERPVESDSICFFYRAYSLPDFSYLGRHLVKGRGPGEFLAPIFGGSCTAEGTENKCEYIFDLMQGRSFAYDFIQSVETGMDVVYPVSELPDGTLYANAYCDTLQFIICIGKDGMFACLADGDGAIANSIGLYPDAASPMNYPQLGNALAINDERGLVAMLMINLPQVNFLDPVTGNMESHAVDKAYRDWKDLISISDIDKAMNSTTYYSWANSTSDYIIATYRGLTINDILQGDNDAHIHIFNWDGDFLYDLALKEGIGPTAYDSARKHLYGLDIQKDRIYRYDLSGLL